MAEWFVELAISESDYRLLHDFLVPPGPSIIKEGSATILRSQQILAEFDHVQARETANAVLEILNGAAKAFVPTYQGARIVSMYFLNDEGTVTRHLLATAPYRDRRAYALKPDDKRLSSWIALSSEDLKAARALALYGGLAHTWSNLYMVMEVIEDDLDGEAALIRQFPLPEYEIKAFKHTANSFPALGPDARHAKDFAPPASPMTLRDAQDLVQRTLSHWLDSKVRRSAPD